MDKKLLRYALIVVIFFIGLSMGVSYHEQNRSRNLQNELSSFEEQITTPGNDFEPVNPVSGEVKNGTPKIKHNLFTGLAKDGEYILKKGVEIVLDTSNDVFRFIFGIK